MSDIKGDRRIKYTKMVLKESLIKILNEKEISKITIKEICEGADINRATFYSHYSDQFDLLHKIEDELLEKINAHLSGHKYDAGEVSTIDMVKQIFEYIKENAQLCRILLNERGEQEFQKRIMIQVYEIMYDQISRSGVSREDADYIYSYTITGCVGIVQKWLYDGMKKPTRNIAELIVKLSTRLNLTQ
jgi:AcrR family transcriptional regulator